MEVLSTSQIMVRLKNNLPLIPPLEKSRSKRGMTPQVKGRASGKTPLSSAGSWLVVDLYLSDMMVEPHKIIHLLKSLRFSSDHDVFSN